MLFTFDYLVTMHWLFGGGPQSVLTGLPWRNLSLN